MKSIIKEYRLLIILICTSSLIRFSSKIPVLFINDVESQKFKAILASANFNVINLISINKLLAVLAVIFFYFIAVKLTNNKTISFISALIFTLDPLNLYIEATVSPAPILAFLLLLGSLLVVIAFQNNSKLSKLMMILGIIICSSTFLLELANKNSYKLSNTQGVSAFNLIAANLHVNLFHKSLKKDLDFEVSEYTVIPFSDILNVDPLVDGKPLVIGKDAINQFKETQTKKSFLIMINQDTDLAFSIPKNNISLFIQDLFQDLPFSKIIIPVFLIALISFLRRIRNTPASWSELYILGTALFYLLFPLIMKAADLSDRLQFIPFMILFVIGAASPLFTFPDNSSSVKRSHQSRQEF